MKQAVSNTLLGQALSVYIQYRPALPEICIRTCRVMGQPFLRYLKTSTFRNSPRSAYSNIYEKPCTFGTLSYTYRPVITGSHLG